MVWLLLYIGYRVGQQPDDSAGKIGLSMLAFLFLGGISILEFKRSFPEQENIELTLDNSAQIEAGIPTERVQTYDEAEIICDEDISVEIAGFTGNIILLGNWKDAELHPQISKNLKKHSKYLHPRKIQNAAIPFIFDGFDVKIQAEIGSGKTLVRFFLLCIFD
uniref:Uncharacterized protein n=1 Tax=Panagrolaimus davidi TaxID=227884 RepID=A0A914Q7V2_9BILA